MMVCQKCGHKLEEGMEYCKFCGTHQEIFEEEFERKSCKFCKKNIPVNANFCSYCGKDQAFINVETFSSEPIIQKISEKGKIQVDEVTEDREQIDSLPLNENARPGILASTKILLRDMFIFQKRMGRADFWWAIAGIFLLSMIFGMVMGEVIVLVEEFSPSSVELVEKIGVSIWVTMVYVAITSAQIRRLHDCSLPSVLILLKFFFGFGDIIVFLLMVLPQSKRDMSYTFKKK